MNNCKAINTCKVGDCISVVYCLVPLFWRVILIYLYFSRLSEPSFTSWGQIPRFAAIWLIFGFADAGASPGVAANLAADEFSLAALLFRSITTFSYSLVLKLNSSVNFLLCELRGSGHRDFDFRKIKNYFQKNILHDVMANINAGLFCRWFHVVI
jgi:hypothetical protein